MPKEPDEYKGSPELREGMFVPRVEELPRLFAPIRLPLRTRVLWWLSRRRGGRKVFGHRDET